MLKKYEERSLIEFQNEFSTEQACASHLWKQRWPQGFVCPSCAHGEYWYISARKILDCKQCRFKSSLTAGTIFHKTRIPLQDFVKKSLAVAADEIPWFANTSGSETDYEQSSAGRPENSGCDKAVTVRP